MVTNRVEFLKKQLRETKPTISLDRARLVTTFYSMASIESPILRKAHLLEFLLDNMKIFIGPQALFVGDHGERYRSVAVYPEWGSKWILEDIDTFDTRTTDKIYWAGSSEKDELISILKEWEGKAFRELVDGALPEEMKAASDEGVITIGSRIVSTASHMPQFDVILEKGFQKMIEECEEKLAGITHYDYETQEQKETWEAMIITLRASIKFADRYADLAEKMAEKEADEERKKELFAIADNCRTVPAHRPKTFYQALQFMWFVHLIYEIENAGHNHSIGRFDQFMYPYFKKDIDDGVMDEEKAIELIQCLLLKWTEIFELRDHIEAEAYAGFPMWTNITIGGIDQYGRDACNRLTYLFLEAAEGAETTQPAISFRYNRKCSKEVLDRAVKLTQKGLGQPAFFSDEINIPRVLADGATVKEARDYAILGCVEATVPGKTDFRPTAGFINILKLLELTLHNGLDVRTGKQIGPKTGAVEDFDTMETFWEAYKKQAAYWVAFHLKAYGICTALHCSIAPTVFASTLIEGCIEKGKTLQKGGAKYSATGTFISGVANTADSLACIEDVVYRKKLMTLQEMVDMLDSNYEGNEVMRQMFLNKEPHFGNDDDFVDEYYRKLLELFSEENDKYKDSRFGNYQLIVLNQTYNIWQGRAVGATPDGRLAGEPMANNGSPSNGMDRNGPTAVANSIGKADTLLVQKGVLINHKFDPAIAKGEKGIKMLEAFLEGYFDAGGQHIQINVVDVKTLRDAQKHPENYRNLMVRVAGYSAFFIDLDEKVQNNIIGRTEHTNCA